MKSVLKLALKQYKPDVPPTPCLKQKNVMHGLHVVH